MDNLNKILSRFNPVSLTEMSNVQLQNRVDTKYVFEASLLPSILSELIPYYSILEIESNRFSNYKTLYYDNCKLNSYTQHHNGKSNRIKVRFREYVESNLSFLEVKFKNNKDRTIKSRIKVKNIEELLSESSKKFIEQHSFYLGNELNPVLWNNFTRLTLVHKTQKERLTIDLNLSFKAVNNGKEKLLKNTIIAEVKQEKMSVNSDFIKTIKKYYIRRSSMSKYCIGFALVNEKLKSNNFKERILKLKKIENAA